MTVLDAEAFGTFTPVLAGAGAAVACTLVRGPGCCRRPERGRGPG